MREVTITDLEAALRLGRTVLDVRETDEYVGGHVPGAVSVPMGQLPRRARDLDRSAPVLVICASGNRSAAMTDYLTAAGFDAASVAGGTSAWVRAGHPVERGAVDVVDLDGLRVVALDTPTLGDRSYLVHDGSVAFVVDPQRDIDRVLELLGREHVTLTHVFETHVHNDYVTGGLALARATGAAYHVNVADPVAFARTPVADGDRIAVGERMTLTVRATPGHTFTHLAYVLTDRATGVDTAVFSGGSLLYGSTGRPDLLGPEHTHALAHHQYASVHALAGGLPDAAAVFPTHGFGSFCSSTQSDAVRSTVGDELRTNPALTLDETTWIEDLIAGLTDHPTYYVHMAPANLAGPAAPDLAPPEPTDAVQLRERIEAGEWVVDLRHRTAFAAGHAPGTVNIGVDGSFATYVGWVVPWGAPITVLGADADQVALARRELVRIGIDRLAGQATGDPSGWTTDGRLVAHPTSTFADLALVRHHRPVVVLDVRRVDEYRAGHLDGAVNIPLHELPDRVDDVPAGEVWVHCAGGYRASIAASLLHTRGRDVVAVDDVFPDPRP